MQPTMPPTTETECPGRQCVIYCRKSSSEGLDRDYTSIDAQRDTCMEYIRQHAADGWEFTGKVYADGGFSGGNTDRPAFQEMMDVARAGMIDVIVIYKLDRISRNKRDFWNLDHELRQLGVTLECATQHVEMKTSCGRVATGIMMDIAEYERDIDSERIIGQIRAARAAGHWAAAKTPYGYRKIDSELYVDREKAARIRYIFSRYPIIKSVKQVAAELNSQFGPKEPGKPWLTRHVYKILQNIAYKGLVAYDGREYQGIHEPLVTPEQWALARKIAASNTADKDKSRQMQSVAEFRGILKCAHCNGMMSPAFTKRDGRRIIYYRCSKDSARAVSTCPIRAISAKEIERPIWNELAKILTTPTFHSMLLSLKPELGNAAESALGDLPKFIEMLYPIERTRIVQTLIKEIRLGEDSLDIFFNTNGAKQIAEEMRHHADNV